MILNAKFNLDSFSNWIEEFLPDYNRDVRKVEIPNGFSDAKLITTLGESDLGVRVFVIETIKDPSGRKVGLAKDSFNLIKNYGTPNALIAYYSESAENWRFSLLTSTPSWNEGKIITKLSNPKRHSYVLGPNAKVNTPSRFLINKGKILDFSDLKSRFSLEVVNKEFYKEISESFTKLVGGTRGEGRNKKTYESVLKLPSTNDHSLPSIEFAVRLIGRVIFCWFLREKISESGSSLMPKKLLSLDAISNNNDYYHKILEPIFFEILNKPTKSRKDNYTSSSFSQIPYLNGGLFSPHDDDFFSYNEGKQAQFHNTVVVPDDWFKEFFSILETYNFTIDENTSIDEDLSIDPEMLGRIFENLLAEINPETGESARKSTGSYYTPRVIVDYMVDESLLLYLKQKTNIDEDKLRAIISYDLSDDASYPLNEIEKEALIDAIEKVKILDPACGSGAFPIGALQKIVFILQQTDPEGQIWFHKQIQNTSPEIRRVMEREFSHKNFDYIRKLGIIRENIYGIDIQPIATEISRLRCFLTLVVDERIDDTQGNRGIEPLPNLDFKFVTANSLIGLPTSDKKNQMGLFEDTEGINDLREIRDMFFNASGSEREQLKLQFVQSQNKMFQRLISENRRGHADLTTMLTTWDPFSHNASAWFETEWMFGLKEGFDIVIGNPPYLRIQGIQLVDPELAKKYKQIYDSATGAFDLYILFLERGLSFLNSYGILNYILPHKWVNSSFGKGIRKLIHSGRNAKKMISFGAHQIFSVSNYTSLLWLTKSENEKLEYFEFSRNFTNNKSLEEVLNQLTTNDFNHIDNNSLLENPWVLTNGIIGRVLSKLAKQPLTVKDVFIKIFQGIATSKDSVYFLKECTERDDIIDGYSEDLGERISIEKGLVKPLLRGEQIHKYSRLETDNYVLFPYKVNKENSFSRAAQVMNSKYIQDNYPKGWDYILRCEKTIKDRERGRLSNEEDWYRYIYPKNISYFEQEKIITPEISYGTNMTLDLEGKYYHNTKCYSLVINPNLKAEYKFYLGILNSKLMWFFLNNTGYILRGGYFTFKTTYLEPFPLPDSSNEIMTKEITNLVDAIYELKHSSVNTNGSIEKIEEKINLAVYKLYGLTSEEIQIVEGEK